MINLLNFNNNYHFGGDFAQYIMQSKLSISELKYEQNYNIYFNSFISETIGRIYITAAINSSKNCIFI